VRRAVNLMPVSDGAGLHIMVICTANRCRSVMAQALLAHRLAVLGVPGHVSSAGLLGEGLPPPQEVVSAMTSYGLDVAGHRSRLVNPDELAPADLILAMARAHLRHVVAAQPPVWPHVFTLKELVRRGQQTGPRALDESLSRWLARVHDGRMPAALLGDSPQDDVIDPIGGPVQGYAQSAAMLSQLVDTLAGLCWRLTSRRLPG
jgi:protein-tyrosine phosphatase